MKEGKLIDRTGKAFLSDIDEFLGFNEEITVVKRKGKSGLINAEGQWILEPEFDQIGDFSL